jgi:hypothetical protein
MHSTGVIVLPDDRAIQVSHAGDAGAVTGASLDDSIAGLKVHSGFSSGADGFAIHLNLDILRAARSQGKSKVKSREFHEGLLAQPSLYRTLFV